MITEIALIDGKPGAEKDFEAAVAKARPLFLRAKGGKGFELHKSIEKPSRYRLIAKWETLENHTVDFRGSEDFTAWRGLVGQYFAAPPEVEHTETVVTSGCASNATRPHGEEALLRRLEPCGFCSGVAIQCLQPSFETRASARSSSDNSGAVA